MLVDAYSTPTSRMRARIEVTEKADAVTEDLLIGLTAELEKEHGMFQAQNRR